ADAFAGAITVASGVLRCAAAGALAGGDVTLRAGTVLDLGGHAQRVARLAGDGSVALQGGELTIAVDDDVVFAGALTGGGSLVKLGDGTMEFSAMQGWDGPLDLRGGSIGFAGNRLVVSVPLRSPLVSRVELPWRISGDRHVAVRVQVPDAAPDDLGLGAFVCDRHGRWFQRTRDGVLAAGSHEAFFALTAAEPLRSEPERMAWSPEAGALCDRSGLFLWSAHAGDGVSVAVDCRLSASTPVAGAHRLLDLGWSPEARTGERWQLACRPDPYPANPYDPASFTLEALVTGPDGRELSIPAFHDQPMRGADRGDCEEVVADGAAGFRVRLRPRLPGSHRIRLIARWADGTQIESELPPLVVDGEPWDDYVRVDAEDRRFFRDARGFHWPIGLNIRSLNDVRCQETLGTRLTPDRGSLAYAAYLDRLAASGADAVEIWMAAWNLGLEWRSDWRGFHGQGRYNEGNAWRLDQVLDHAWRRGVRVNLVIMNHGQGSIGNDHEWELSPYNRSNGGRIDTAAELFTDPWALAGQEAYRRYLCARWADHPAVLGWKLWSEVNLTQAGANVVPWHERACARWAALDIYDHPITSHWAGDYTSPDRGVVALPGLDYVCIDAYHQGGSLPDLIEASTLAGNGLAQYGKPVLVTEYGASWGAGPSDQIAAELASTPFVAAVTGHGGSPMLWWYEWVDQGERWAPYGAVRRFLVGEDLRGGASRRLPATAEGVQLWCRCWQKPGRILGYALDTAWVRRGGPAGAHAQLKIPLGAIAAGSVAIEWWDADRGVVLDRATIAHPGGDLVLAGPPLIRHLAFKLTRLP
ncbi:MAG: hypothetical protein H0W72_15345, partial [Planctomycetes bacterium]|nr:hypothetical protein [Planctomycetota bacterium]